MLVVATLLGFYCQSIAYFLSEQLGNIDEAYCITAVTVTSILLFISSPVIGLVYREKIKFGVFHKYLFLYGGVF